MERAYVTTIFTKIRTSKSTLYVIYDKSHSKTHTTIISFSILLQILDSPTKKQENSRRFQFKNRRKQEQAQKIGKKQEKIGTGHPALKKIIKKKIAFRRNQKLQNFLQLMCRYG